MSKKLRYRALWAVVLSAWLLWPMHAQAQGFKGVVEGLWKWFISPNKHVDSTYIYQSSLLWTARVQNDLHKSMANMDTDGKTQSMSMPESDYAYALKSRMRTHAVDEVGVFIALRSLSVGYMREVGSHRGNSSRSSYLNLMNAGYGFNVRYNKVYGPMRTMFTNKDNGKEADLSSEKDARMRSIAIDGYYALNQKRFAYDAAYDGAYIQQRSAGSLLLTAKYTFGELSLPTDDYTIIPLNNGVSRYKTYQLAIGPGYSYNWVPYHRPARDSKRSGIRNLTVNMTFAPMLTVLNNMTCFNSKFDEESDSFRETGSTHLRGGINLNLIARCAVSYTFGRYALYGTFDYHQVSMKDNAVKHYEADEWGFDMTDEFTTTTRIRNWAASVVMSVSF